MQQQTTANANNGSQLPLLTVTPSNVLYLACHRKYNELAIHKRWPGMKSRSPALRFSTALHKALRQVYDPKSGTPPHTANLGGYIRAAFLSETYEDSAAREHDVCRAARLLSDYVEGDEDGPYTLAVEKTGIFQVAAGDLTYLLHARLDRALVRPQEPDVLVVRDYKIGRLALEPEQVVINLAVAKMLWPNYRAYTLEIEGIVDEGLPERLVYHSRECRGIIGSHITPKIRRFVQDTEYPAEMGEQCLYCGAKAGCPAHSQNAVNADALDFEE